MKRCGFSDFYWRFFVRTLTPFVAVLARFVLNVLFWRVSANLSKGVKWGEVSGGWGFFCKLFVFMRLDGFYEFLVRGRMHKTGGRFGRLAE